ncbi:MAG: hypothetical protein P0119_20665 [Nitrospira sp.]|nr:hypothetical protein [Nitrospira sp.]
MPYNERTVFHRVIFHRYVRLWMAVALLFAGLLGLAEYQRNPLNDPDQAQQRTGVLLPPRQGLAPKVPAMSFTDRPTVIIFDRDLTGRHLFHDLADQSDLTRNAELVVVTHDGSRPIIEARIDRVLVDPDEAVAGAFELRRPIDGGYPVGYVLVDSSGFIRFRTLDPGYDRRAWEIKLLLSEM